MTDYNQILQSLQSNPLFNTGLGMLAASGPSRMPVSFGQTLASGMQFQQQQAEQARRAQYQQALMKAMQQRQQMQQEQQQRAAQERAALFQPQQPMQGQPPQQTMSPAGQALLATNGTPGQTYNPQQMPPPSPSQGQQPGQPMLGAPQNPRLQAFMASPAAKAMYDQNPTEFWKQYAALANPAPPKYNYQNVKGSVLAFNPNDPLHPQVVYRPPQGSGTPGYRQMTPDQLKAAGLAPGTVAYVGANGLPKIIQKPSDSGDALGNLSPEETALARKLATYGILPTSVGRGKERARILAAALELNPDFNLANAAAGYNFMKDLSRTSPTSAGGTIQSAKTVIQHLDGLMKASKGLAQHDWTWLNSAQNASANVFGDPAYNNWTQATTFVTQELGKMLKGGVASEGEVKQLEGKLSAAASPEQRRDAIAQIAEFMYGKVRAIENRRDSLLGNQSPHTSFLSKREQDILTQAMSGGGINIPDYETPNEGSTYANGAQQGTQTAPAQQHVAVNPNTGEKMTYDPDKKAWVPMK